MNFVIPFCKAKNAKKPRFLFLSLLLILAICAVGIYVFADGEEKNYYVCLSSQNYAVRNANLMTYDEESGEYRLQNITLNGEEDFYITDNAGIRYYGADDKPVSVEDSGSYAYTILFHPTQVYEDTGCHIRYLFYEPATYLFTVNDQEYTLQYNPYQTDYDLYYYSSLYLNKGDKVSYPADQKVSTSTSPLPGNEESSTEEEVETQVISASGYYRILFTPGKNAEGNLYLFNKEGEYGTGDGYENCLFIEDAPQYYFQPTQALSLSASTNINGKSAYYLSRYEKNISVSEYRSVEFFVSKRDFILDYTVYEVDAGGNFRALDDDNNEDTKTSRLTISDVGWYTFSFTDGGTVLASSVEYSEKNFGGFYAVGDFDGYGFDESGNVSVYEKYRFVLIEQEDSDYNEEYDQYILYLSVTKQDLRDGDVEFFISDGENLYKNGNDYIVLNREGVYKILFSDDHLYGSNRHYRYTLEDEDKDYTELTISTVEEFLTFAENCSASADYSADKLVYLTADLDFSSVEFKSIQSFSGKFFGGYHTLSGITLTDDPDHSSVFLLVTRNATIERVKLENLTLGGRECDYVGFIGENYGKVIGVTVSGTLSGREYVGSVVAYNGRSEIDDDSATVDSADSWQSGVIQDCVGNAQIRGERSVGGIAGFNYGEIISCTNSGQIIGYPYRSDSQINQIGGIAGYSAGRITDCQNSGAIGNADVGVRVGGIAGISTGGIYFSTNQGTVFGERQVGGIVGYYGTISESSSSNTPSYSYADVLTSSSDNEEDDDVAEEDGTEHILTYCYNLGNVTAVSYAGGVLGYTSTTLSLYNSISIGDVKATAGSYAGGIAGYATPAAIEGCMAAGTISATGLSGGEYVGGIAGYGESILACASFAVVSGSDYIGGIVGYHTSTLSSCYSDAVLVPESDTHYQGMIAGYSEAYQASSDSFRSNVYANYYIGTQGGIHSTDYASAYSYAAASIESEDLISYGSLSPYLSGDFNCDFWQGGSDDVSYPILAYLSNARECSTYGDEEEYLRFFDKISDELVEVCTRYAVPSYTVTFMEWNQDNGDLYDENGKLLTDHFEIISTIRTGVGQSVSAPAPIYAIQQENGSYLYETDEAHYFVEIQDAISIGSNLTIYANYYEIATSVSVQNGRLLVEGKLDSRIQIQLVPAGESYTVTAEIEGTPVSLDGVTLKIKPEGDPATTILTVYQADGEKIDRAYSISGDYIQFVFHDGEYFSLSTILPKNTTSIWPILLGTLVGAAAVGIGWVSYLLVSKKKSILYKKEKSERK